ncbi:FAD/NAD(P)-binding protein [Sulfitobacter sp. F26169L]|uniref:FAD/NAD(P)-binding protein n=1 Tax=Sulfitobacter sp. F26169L TaxID=2996015 RepID=UPI002260EAFD|nr:FAD/NAD(P)-binding domain-containing protein [Sulfitobacter sp. F26169L]MCX7567101.1 FAD/NAD(P)-binding protein [Sulfitobacter sp. F26169L]
MCEVGNLSKIAVVGVGPRGLGALEALVEQCQDYECSVAVDVFDPYAFPGAGPNFSPDESPQCLLNIPIRDIAFRAPSFSNCDGFAGWLGTSPDPDSFPSRADLGRYLQARYEKVLAQNTVCIKRLSRSVDRIRPCAGGWQLDVEGCRRGPYHEVLLTLGQPKTEPDEQFAEWQDHAERVDACLTNAYPAKHLVEQAEGWSENTVAIRGLGLSVFDVIRALTTAQGGRFHDHGYSASGREPERIMAFSLTGKPPFPKPETGRIDALFDPLQSETEAFSQALDEAIESGPQTAAELINAVLAPVVGRLMQSLGVTVATKDITQWLETEWDSPDSYETEGPVETLRIGIELAEGSRAPTIGFSIGQVWRKWQNVFRSKFNPAEVDAGTAGAIVGFDDGLKRYSYGPPVSSAREMLALINAGILDLSFAADPEIRLTDTGWLLKKEGETASASVMIDSVQPSPDLSKIVDLLLRDLISQGLVHPVSEGLGAMTDADGRLLTKQGDPLAGLCFLGRLALGSVVAVDSLDNCFGEDASRWAKGVLNRLTAGDGVAA